MICRLILPDYAQKEHPELPKVVEGDYTHEEILNYNSRGYNCYFFPNGTSHYEPGSSVDGSQIDQFNYVFVDCDLKDGIYESKEDFKRIINNFTHMPSSIVDSGNGIHCYWQISDLDSITYLKLQRKLCRYFKTDEAVGKICQLMRIPGTLNTKVKDNFLKCEVLSSTNSVCTSEQLSKVLPLLSPKDEEYCKSHYDRTYGLEKEIAVSEDVPRRFLDLLKNSKEIKALYSGNVRDRSKADYKLAHLLYAENFTKEEAMSVLINCRKALDRAPAHRNTYAMNIVDKIWEFEKSEDKEKAPLSKSVREILRKGNSIVGSRFPCWDVFDGTESGFRLTQIMGLVGGSGSGKTTVALNYFYHFTVKNPNYLHIFVSLEQPEIEIAQRWARIAGEHSNLHDRVHVLGNYEADGSYRNLSLSDIEDYIMNLKKSQGVEIGCVCIDHVGVLKKKSKEQENQALIDVFHGMKAFANHLNCFLIMQSQTSREKAGIGDVELNKDSAYGSTVFEWYCDYIVTTWQPLKRLYKMRPDMTCSAFAMPKIRNKNVNKDRITEEDVFVLMFDTETERLRQMTQIEQDSYDFLAGQANSLRNTDRKREPKKITKIEFGTGKDLVKIGKSIKNNQRQ